ncbi:hypothetical protein J4441_00400 [Candidatus Micrarchaeota archaeon]|nr:hypothetical protein [Candidatus Micrarchaeota archaeon]
MAEKKPRQPAQEQEGQMQEGDAQGQRYYPQQAQQEYASGQQEYASGQYAQQAEAVQAQAQYAQPAANKTPSGIHGFDDLVEGGYEVASINLVVGPTGCGKTTFAMQFLYNGVVQFNEPAVLISFEEPKTSIYEHMGRFGWDFAALEQQGAAQPCSRAWLKRTRCRLAWITLRTALLSCTTQGGKMRALGRLRCSKCAAATTPRNCAHLSLLTMRGYTYIRAKTYFTS